MIDLLLRRWHRLRQAKIPESLPLSPVGLDDGGETMRAVLATRPVLEKILRENIIPFWVERSVDRENGGFLLNHGSGRGLVGARRKGVCAPVQDGLVLRQGSPGRVFARRTFPGETWGSVPPRQSLGSRAGRVLLVRGPRRSVGRGSLQTPLLPDVRFVWLGRVRPGLAG